MTDLVHRLRIAAITEVNPKDDQSYVTGLGDEAADGIERLRAALTWIAELGGDDLDDLFYSNAKATIIERLRDCARNALGDLK